MSLFAKKETATLKIGGMTCASCQKHVGEALRGVPGVASASVDLVFHRASVTYDPQQAKVEDLVEAVRKSGYEAQPLPAKA